MQVCDDNVPQKCDVATAYVTVQRSQSSPTFIDTPYRVSISEFRAVESSIFKVRDMSCRAPNPFLIKRAKVIPFIVSQRITPEIPQLRK